jgi:signal transduction histidine kinase
MSPGPTTALKGNIAIVDDTLPNLRVLSKMLTDHGYLVRGMPNGAMAIKAITSEPPDLVLLDILMPDMDGYAVCKRLKADERTRNVPVIFMSALDEVMDKVEAFSVGGVDYITKPFQVEEVLARVDTHVTLQLLRRRLEIQVMALERANAALKESNDELNAFARTVAHDIKGPLGNIVMGADILQRYTEATHDKAVIEVAQGVGTSARKTINIVDELLLLASVRQESVDKRPLDMADIVGQAQSRLRWMVDGCEGQIKGPESWPVAEGYAPWVEEIWVNYLSNGLKYGGCPPCLVLGGAEHEDGTIRFWVKDNGPGIPPDKLRSLFTEFTRIERTRAEGHGLGLSIVRRIATKLGGDVGVESTVGEGSTFYFVLPGSNGPR